MALRLCLLQIWCLLSLYKKTKNLSTYNILSQCLTLCNSDNRAKISFSASLTGVTWNILRKAIFLLYSEETKLINLISMQAKMSIISKELSTTRCLNLSIWSTESTSRLDPNIYQWILHWYRNTSHWTWSARSPSERLSSIFLGILMYMGTSRWRRRHCQWYTRLEKSHGWWASFSLVLWRVSYLRR